MKDKIDKKFVAKLAKEKLKEGKSRQQVYEELVEEFKYRNDVADVVVHLPSPIRWEKHGLWNNLFLTLLVLMTVLNLLKPSIAIVGWAGLFIL